MKRLLIIAALLAWSGLAGAVVYKWVDAQGKVQYGDRPPDGVHAQLVEISGAHGAPSESGEGKPTPAAAPAKSRADEAVKKAVAEDVAQTREKQCSEAQERYKKLIEGRRLYKSGPNGEREFLTSEEIDAQRLEAKRAINEVCNSSN